MRRIRLRHTKLPGICMQSGLSLNRLAKFPDAIFGRRSTPKTRRLRFLYEANLGMYDVIRIPKEPPMKYTVILQRENDGGYVVSVPALPGCVSQGDSREEALKNIEEAIELYLEDVKAAGEPVPAEDGREYVEVTAGSK